MNRDAADMPPAGDFPAAVCAAARNAPTTPALILAPAVVVRRANRLAAALATPNQHLDRQPSARRLAVRYAVKAGPYPPILSALAAAGHGAEIASLAEAELTAAAGIPADRTLCANPMIPAADLPGLKRLGIRCFVIDSPGAIGRLAKVIPAAEVLVRVATPGPGAVYDLSAKFGAAPAAACRLLTETAAAGLVPRGLAFHVGSQARDAGAWMSALAACAAIFAEAHAAGMPLRTLDLGGGLPAAYLAPARPATGSGSGHGRPRCAARNRRFAPPSGRQRGTVAHRGRRAAEDMRNPAGQSSQVEPSPVLTQQLTPLPFAPTNATGRDALPAGRPAAGRSVGPGTAESAATAPPDPAEAMIAALATALRLPPWNEIELWCEPGRYLAAPAGWMLSTVLGIAHRDAPGDSTPGGISTEIAPVPASDHPAPDTACQDQPPDRQHAAVGGRRPVVHLDTGVYHGMLEVAPWLGGFCYPVRCLDRAGPLQPCQLVGPTCDCTDRFNHDYLLPADLAVGDRLLFGLAGAYAVCCSTAFNGFPPPIVIAVDETQSA